MAERIISGVLTAIALAITALVVGLLLTLYRGGPGTTETVLLWTAMPKLLLLLSAIGLLAGIVLGPNRAVNLLSHVWGTAHPRRPVITILMWLALIVLWLAAFNVKGKL